MYVIKNKNGEGWTGAVTSKSGKPRRSREDKDSFILDTSWIKLDHITGQAYAALFQELFPEDGWTLATDNKSQIVESI